MNADSRLASSDDLAGASSRAADHDLYLERLETLYAKQLGDLRAFAAREGQSFDEVRRCIAQWHCKTLFGTPVTSRVESDPRQALPTTMKAVSNALESLQAVAGLQSFLLIINPNDVADEGFLGGTVQGREFWRGHRGCGTAGAQAFKLFCQKSTQHGGTMRTQATGPAQMAHDVVTTNIASSKKGTASAVKSEVYASVRNAVRVASRMRNAEMKWTNHEKLSAYGVRLEGWPADVPIHNPSHLSTAQNKAVLEALESGRMKFVPIALEVPATSHAADAGRAAIDSDEGNSRNDADIFEDTFDFSAYPEGNDQPKGQFLTLDFRVGATHPPADDAGADASVPSGRTRSTDFGLHAHFATTSDTVRSNGVDHSEVPTSESKSSHDTSSDAYDDTSARKRRRVAGKNDEARGTEVRS